MTDLKDDLALVFAALANNHYEAFPAYHRIASAVGELEHLRSRIEALPELFDMSTFVRAGLSFSDASTALMVSRSILENAERAEEERARKAAAEPGKAQCGSCEHAPHAERCEVTMASDYVCGCTAKGKPDE